MNYQQRYHNWLTHLIGAVPQKGYGTRLSMYMIALEAWRRGLQVSFYLEENEENRTLIRYVISDQDASYQFNSSLGERVTEEAYKICDHKDRTKFHLEKEGFNVPKGKLFGINGTYESIYQYANDLGYPLVVKPLNANTGKGVQANIKNSKELTEAITYIKSLGYTNVILEERVIGTEYRILVLNSRVLAVVERVPANIIGDGESTVQQLIDMKNKYKNKNPNLYDRLIQADSEVMKKLSEKDYTMDSIIPENKTVLLRDKVGLDGDPIDVTEQISEKVKEVSIKAVKSIPGLDLCGLDVIENNRTGEITIIEMNTRPMLGLHTFPIKGKPRDVMSPIIDYYFPETKGKIKSNLYFNFNSVIAPILDRSVREVTLQPIRNIEPYVSKRLLLKKLSTKKKFIVEMIGIARNLKINGVLRELNNDEWEVIAGAQTENVLHDFIKNLRSKIRKTEVKFLFQEDWKYPINTGFRLRKISKNIKSLGKARLEAKKMRVKVKRINDKKKSLKIELKKSQSDFNNLKNKYNALGSRLNDILNSKSWKITNPLRKMMGWLSRI